MESICSLSPNEMISRISSFEKSLRQSRSLPLSFVAIIPPGLDETEFLQDVGNGWCANLLEFVGDAHRRLGEFQDAQQVDGCTHDDDIARSCLDGLTQIFDLFIAVAHGRQDAHLLGVLLEGGLYGADCIGMRVDDLGCAIFLGSDISCTVRHFSVRERRTVLDHQNSLAANHIRVLDEHRRSRLDHDGLGFTSYMFSRTSDSCAGVAESILLITMTSACRKLVSPG